MGGTVERGAALGRSPQSSILHGSCLGSTPQSSHQQPSSAPTDPAPTEAAAAWPTVPRISIKVGPKARAQSVAEGCGPLLGWLWTEPSSSRPWRRAHFWAWSCSRGSIRKRRSRSLAGSHTLVVGQTCRTDQGSAAADPAAPTSGRLVPNSRPQPSWGAAAASRRSRSVSACRPMRISPGICWAIQVHYALTKTPSHQQ